MSHKIGLLLALGLSASAFAQQPGRELIRLKPLTRPVKPRPRDANAAAMSCPAPAAPALVPGGVSAAATRPAALGLATLTPSIGQPASGGCSSVSGRICRDEISLFYQGAHSLGTAWVRAVFEDVFPSALAISQIQNSLDNLTAGLRAAPCVHYDLNYIASLRNQIPHLDSNTIVDYVGALIPDIQNAIHNAALPCDSGANLEALFVVGVDLGASIAEAIGFMYFDPLDSNAIGFITDLMNDATSAMASYVPCSNNFPPSLLRPANFDLANDLVLVPLTQLEGTYNLLVWNISLSCCCCSCR